MSANLAEIKAVATDFDFVLAEPYFTRYLKHLHRLLRKVSPEFTEWLVSLPSKIYALRLLEYMTERALLNNPVFNGNHSPLVNPLTLYDYSERGLIGCFTRGPKEPFERKLVELGYRGSMTVVVGSEDVGFIGTTRKEYIPECINRLGVPPHHVLVMSDSPSDLIKARDNGARICGVPSGYHSIEALERVRPEFGVRPTQQVFEMLLYGIG